MPIHNPSFKTTTEQEFYQTNLIRDSKIIAINNLAIGASLTTNLVIAKSFLLLNIACLSAVRIRLYSDAASQTNDLSRIIGVAASASTKLIAEVVTTAALNNIEFSPVAIGFAYNINDPYYLTINNRTDSLLSTSVYLTYMNLEP